MISITQIIVLLLVGVLLFGNIRKIVEQVMDSISAIKRWQNKEKTQETTAKTNITKQDTQNEQAMKSQDAQPPQAQSKKYE